MLPLNPVLSAPAERELQEEPQERPMCCVTMACPCAWPAAALKEVINSQAPAQDKQRWGREMLIMLLHSRNGN